MLQEPQEFFPVQLRICQNGIGVLCTGDQQKFTVSGIGVHQIHTVLGDDESVILPVDQKQRDMIVPEGINGTHLLKGIAICQFRAVRRRADKQFRDVCAPECTVNTLVISENGQSATANAIF